MPLPSRWVDSLFSKLTVTYGAEFLRKYEGVQISDVKADWAEELSGYQQNPDAIKHALENLPLEKPPSVLQFRELCRKAPLPKFKALPAPDIDPAMAQAVKAAVKPIGKATDPLEWAKNLRDREAVSPKSMSMFQRHAWREALKLKVTA